MTVNNQTDYKLDNLVQRSLNENLDNVAPNFRKKNTLSDDQIERIIKTISINLGIPPEKVLIGIYLLFLQGAASAGAPATMVVELGDGKCIEKRNLTSACSLVTGNAYIRRIAETLAIQIGDFAQKNKLAGELAYRINNKVKAETGNNLSEKEMAYCSSFSQAIPNLAEITSERLSKLLAEDYQRRFENKKKKSDKPEAKVNKTKKQKR